MGAYRDLEGSWQEIKPERGCNPGQWVFAAYREFDSQGEEKRVWFLFRDEGRSTFGSMDVTEPNSYEARLRHLATRVVCDRAFRESLISDAPWLARLWRRH